MLQKELFDGTPVPAIWQGCSNVSEIDIETQVRVWVEGIRFGCNALDTAELYGKGRSEMIVGETLKKVNRENVFVATKVAPENLHRMDLIHACERSLKRMGTDYVDLYQVHWNNPSIPLMETMDAMMQLRRDGKIRYIGVSNFTFSQIRKCNTLLIGELATVQMEYNLYNMISELDIVPYCEQMGVLFLAYSPFNVGKLSVKNNVLKEIARKYGVTVGQVTLNWLISSASVCALPKTSNLKHLIENAQSTEFMLEDEEVERIGNEFRPQIIKLLPSEISLEKSTSGVETKVSAYKTVQEALENKLNFLPTPVEMAEEAEQNKQLSKPIFVSLVDGKYELVAGSTRYWAWVIAFGMDAPIECVIVRGK